MRNPGRKYHPENHGRVMIFFIAAVVSLALSMMTWRGAALVNSHVWSLWEQPNIESTADAAVIPPALSPTTDGKQAAGNVASMAPAGVAGAKRRRVDRPVMRDYSHARDALLRIFATSIESERRN